MSESAPVPITSPRESRRPRTGLWIAAGIGLLSLAVAVPFGLSRYNSWHIQRSKDFARQCRKLRQAKDWKQLAVVADEWKTWDAQNSDAILFRAEAAQGSGDFQLTADLLNSVPPSSPKRLAALIERTGLLFGQLNRPLEAVQACHEILAIEPRSFPIHQRLIYYYAMTLQQENLLRQIYRSIELGSEPVEAYVYLMLADALTFQNGFEVTNRWLTADVNEETFLVSRTIHLWKNLSLDSSPNEETQEKLRLAEKLLEDYREKYPNNLAVLSFFATLAVSNGQVDQMETLLSQFPPEAEKDSRFWHFKGWFLAANDEFAAAETAYRESLKIYPFSWSVQHQLADILRRKREFSEVAAMQDLALIGKNLRQKLMEMPDARSVTTELLRDIRDYAEKCGDDFIAESLTKRLATLTKS